MPNREDDVRRIVAGARERGFSDDQIRALVARYDERTQPEPAQPEAKPGGYSLGGLVQNVGADLEAMRRGVVDLFDSSKWGEKLDAAMLARRQAQEEIPARRPEFSMERFKQNVGKLPGELADFAYQHPVSTAAMVVPGPVGRVVGQRVVTPLVRRAGQAAEAFAPQLVQAAIKPTVAALKGQAGASVTGLQGQAEDVAQMMLRNRFTNSGQAADAIRRAETDIQRRVITDPNANVQPLLDLRRVEDALNQLRRDAGQAANPGQNLALIEGARQGVMHGPLAQTVQRQGPVRGMPTMALQNEQRLRAGVTPYEGLQTARATGRWDNRAAWGELKGAEQEASKATERGLRASIAEAVPTLAPAMRRQHEALELYPLLDRMALRQANRDVVGLPAYVMAAGAGTPVKGAMLAGLAEYLRRNQLRLGYGAQDIGRFLGRNAGRAGRLPTRGAQAALLAALLGDESMQPAD